jgi:hypothetical protein
MIIGMERKMEMRNRNIQIWIAIAIGIIPVGGFLLAEDLNSGSKGSVSSESLTIPAVGRLGLEASAGLHGSLSFIEVGALWPLKHGKMFVGLRAKTMSSITWATLIDLEDGETASFHPVVVGGALTIGGASPLVHGFLNLIGNNLTFAYYGFFGFEIYTSSRIAIFLDAGGGFKSLVGDDENIYAIASSWLGSGVGLRMGMTFYP